MGWKKEEVGACMPPASGELAQAACLSQQQNVRKTYMEKIWQSPVYLLRRRNRPGSLPGFRLRSLACVPSLSPRTPSKTQTIILKIRFSWLGVTFYVIFLRVALELFHIFCSGEPFLCERVSLVPVWFGRSLLFSNSVLCLSAAAVLRRASGPSPCCHALGQGETISDKSGCVFSLWT